MLDRLQLQTFQYFLKETNPHTGLVADKSRAGWPASIAATGLALTSYPVGVERGFLSREEAVERCLTVLRFFRDAPHGPERDATGYHGFYYHFLDMDTGRRAWRSELSTVDTGFLLAGALAAARYFDRDLESEIELAAIAEELYRRADWQWAQNGQATICHGWKPESGFLRYHWKGYDEALLLYLLGLGSPTFPLPGESYDAWLSTYRWKRIYGFEYIYAGPLFIHHLPQVWLDCRGIRDRYVGERDLDYFENSRRATQVQREYAIRNPKGFAAYSPVCWGFTASDGPGPTSRKVDGIERRFYDYIARGAPYGPDDGTIAPWAVVASLPMAPEIVVPALRYMIEELELPQAEDYGFKATFNPTFVMEQSPLGWISPWNFGLNQGPIILMIENYRSELIWKLMRGCSHLVRGLRRAGFRGGWL